MVTLGTDPVGRKLIEANARISGAISSGNAVADTLDIKIEYHTY